MLEELLKPLANKLKAAVTKGEIEVNSRGMFYSGQAVLLKKEYWLGTIPELSEIHARGVFNIFGACHTQRAYRAHSCDNEH